MWLVDLVVAPSDDTSYSVLVYLIEGESSVPVVKRMEFSCVAHSVSHLDGQNLWRSDDTFLLI